MCLAPNKIVDVFLVDAPQLCILLPLVVMIHKVLKPRVELGLGISEEEEPQRGDAAVVIVRL